MKIGIDIRTLMDRRYSGVSNYTLELVNELLRQDKVNQYKLYYNSGQDISTRIPAFNFANAEVVTTRIPNKVFNYWLQKTLRRPLLDRLLGVDVFLMPHINFVALSPQCKKIITIHDISFLRYHNFFSLRKNIWHKLIGIKKLLSSFDVIVAVSENTRRDLIELLNIPTEKIKVIYSGIGSNFLSTENNASAAVRLKYQLPEKYFLFLGNLEPRKNIENVILAYDQFIDRYPQYKDCHLVLAGEKGWEYKNIFYSINNARHRDIIHLLGYIDEKDKAGLYGEASIFIYPSFYEGFGFPVLEALICGVPVITSTNSSLPEVAQNAAIMVNPFNINDIIAAICQVLAEKDKTKNTKLKAGDLQNKFNWAATAEKYRKLFTSFN